MFTDEDFMKDLEEQCPDVDWNNIPSVDSKPTHFVIRGMQWHRLDFVFKKKEIKSKCGFEWGRFDSKEEAESALKELPNHSILSKEQLIEDQTVSGHELEENSLAHKEYIGPFILDTLHIVELHDEELVNLQLCKSFRDDILAGKSIFPMYLP